MIPNKAQFMTTSIPIFEPFKKKQGKKWSVSICHQDKSKLTTFHSE